MLDLFFYSAQVIEVRQHLNSFQRLLYYKIADRFFINHSYSDYNEVRLFCCIMLLFSSAITTVLNIVLSQYGEKSLALCKTPNTRIPNPLLIDIPILPGGSSPSHTTMGSQRLNSPTENRSSMTIAGVVNSSGSALGTGNRSPSTPEGMLSGNGQGTKKLLLKRAPLNDRDARANAGAGSSQRSSYQSGSEKEKLYAEAKARIFRDAQAAASAGSAPSGEESVFTETSTNTSTSIEQPPKPSSAQVESPVVPTQAPIPVKTESIGVPNRSGSASPSVVTTSVNNGNGGPKAKFTPRDYANEKSDPDFARRSGVAVRTATNAASSSAQQQLQQQQQQQQQHQQQQQQQHYNQHQPPHYPPAPYGSYYPHAGPSPMGPGYYIPPIPPPAHGMDPRGDVGYYGASPAYYGAQGGVPGGYMPAYGAPSAGPGAGYMYPGVYPGAQYAPYPTMGLQQQNGNPTQNQLREEEFPPLGSNRS